MNSSIKLELTMNNEFGMKENVVRERLGGDRGRRRIRIR